VNELRKKFGKRPGLLTNSNVAQPEAGVDVVVGRDNPRLMPVEVLRSEKDGKDLYIMRNFLMMFGETSGTALKKKGAAGGARTTSTPKPRQLKAKDPQTASKRPVKAAPVRTPAGQQAARGDRGAAHSRAIRRQEQPPAGQLTSLICGGL
jgi:hypothetical protein